MPSRRVTFDLAYAAPRQYTDSVLTEALTILLANRNQPVIQPISPLAVRRAYNSSYVISVGLFEDEGRRCEV